MELSGKFHPAAYLPLGKELTLPMASELAAEGVGLGHSQFRHFREVTTKS